MPLTAPFSSSFSAEQSIQEAIDKRTKVSFLYADKEGTLEKRTVLPDAYGRSLLKAWCESRKALRTFWIPRMYEIEIHE